MVAEPATNRESYSVSPWTASTDLLLRIARRESARHGLTGESAEDCAMEFVARMLREEASPLSPERCSPAWLHRCAENFVRNYQRARRRRERHELAWPESESGGGDLLEIEDDAAGFEGSLLREEFWGCITAALDRLSPAARELFLQHHLENRCIGDLAARVGRTPHAVEQTLFRIRKQMRAILERQGLTETVLRAYLRL